MASNAYQNFDEGLTNSSSNEDLSPVLPDIGTRTRQPPRSHVPIEARVSVSNGRQEETANERDLGSGSLRHQIVEVSNKLFTILLGCASLRLKIKLQFIIMKLV